MTKEQIMSLIDRMNTVEDITDSSHSISFKAHREAEQIADITLLPILQEIILGNSKPKGKKIRNSAYFIMGKLLKTQFDLLSCEFFIHQLEEENDKYILSGMLDRLADLNIPESMDISPVVLLSKSEKWLIRHSAINALGACGSEESKAALAYYLQQDDEKTYRYEITYANAALGRIGNETDISLLEKHADSRLKDVRNSAMFAINAIMERIK